MTIEFEISKEQEGAMARSNAAANADPETRPSDHDFIVSACNEKINQHVSAWSQRDLESTREAVLKSVEALDSEKLTQVLDLANSLK